MPSAEFKKKGTFADAVLPALLVHAVNARFTGMFRAERDSIIKVIYFKEGEIAFASSNQPSDRLGEVLIKRGQLTREQLDMAMSKLEANVSLGRMLVELGYLSPKELLSGAKTQVEEILYSLNGWKEGGYEFTEGPLPPRIVDLKLNTRQVIFQCILQVEDRRWALDQIGSMESVFAPQHELVEALSQMRLEPEVQQVITNIDGANNVRDLAARSQLDEFTVTKIVGALYLLNLTRMTAHEADEHGGEYLARFGEETGTTTTGDSTVIGRPPGSETMPGFAPGFGAQTAGFGGASASGSYGNPFGGSFEEPAEETASRTSPSFVPTPMAGSLDDEPEPESTTRPGFAQEEPLVSPADDDGDGGEEMAYEEEALDEETEGGGRPRWLIPAIAAALLLLVCGGLAWWFLGRSAPGGGESTPVARLSATPTRVAMASPGTGPGKTPVVSTSPIAGTTPIAAMTSPITGSTPLVATSPVTSSSPLTSLSPSASAIAAMSSPTPFKTTSTPVAAMTVPVTGAHTPTLMTTPMAAHTPTPAVTVATAASSPLRTPSVAPTHAIATPTLAVAATRIASAATPQKTVSIPGVVSSTPLLKPTPTPAHVAALSPPPTPVKSLQTPRPQPTTATPAHTPIPTRTVPAATGGGGALAGAAAASAHEKLAAGQYREAAQGFRQAAQATSGYSIQLEIVCQESSIKEGLANTGQASEYFVLPFTHHGRSCYRAFWGVYPSRAAAEQAQRSLPAFFRNQARGRSLPIVPVSGAR